MPAVFIDTLGCAKNQVDSEEIATRLSYAGYTVILDPETADIIIVNTCGFIEAAKQEAINTLLYYRNQYPNKKILGTGCLVQRYIDDLSRELPEIDGFAGNGSLTDVVTAIKKLDTAPHPVIHSKPTAYIPIERTFNFSFKGQAYIKISEGCSNHCSYCAIPLIRGELTSRPFDDILRECEHLIAAGIYELTLIGQDLGSYGKDSGTGHTLFTLLTALTALEGNFIIRLLYIHPDHFPYEILEIMEKDKRLIPYFDIPFQHASKRILSAMNRKGNSETYLQLLETIRRKVPNAVIRSTFLTGFPGETEEDFNELLSFQRLAQFDWLGAFVFSREEDTIAYAMKNRVRKSIAEERKKSIEALQQTITEKKLTRYLGTEQTILIEERIEDTDLSIGRGYMQAPEVDGATVVVGSKAAPGETVTVRITAIRGIDLEGSVLP